MAGLKTSLICTVLNEEQTIDRFLNSVLGQTKLPTEIIIVDGGSKDKTREIIESKYKKKLKIKLIIKKGNRSIGRNVAIKQASNEIILITDSGNILDKKWIEEISKPFTKKDVKVVAGYYKGKASNSFQQSLIPYVLVMPDKVDKNNFLPATRSMAIRKSLWKKLNGFNEQLSHNEDYDFAKKIVKSKIKIFFAEKAIVNWIPRKSFKQTFIMFFRFAFGDIEAGILRGKVSFLFLRYFLLLYFLFLTFVYKSKFLAIALMLAIVMYPLWAIRKNSRYVKSNKKYIFLPLIQLIADAAVITGSILGLIKNVLKFKIIEYALRNKFLSAVLIIYLFSVLIQIYWGIPNQNHPFLYHMDEWHQLQAVRFVYKFGTPNMAGAANGTMFHFFYTGLYLLPFMLLKIINPFAIKSAIDNISAQQNLFLVLRIESLLFGILTLITFFKTVTLLKINKQIGILFFTFTPLWLMLSNYFKYDIALTFWLTLSVYLFIKYYKNHNLQTFLLSGFVSSLAFSVKVSALPIFIIFIFSYLLFTKERIKNVKYLFIGIFIFISTSIIFGLPDAFFSGHNIYNYLYDNLVSIPNMSNNVNTGYSYLQYVFFFHFPTVIGHSFYVLFLILFAYFIIQIKENPKLNLFILISFLVFLFSLIPLKFFIVGNRLLVLLPYIALISSISLTSMINKLSKTKIKLLSIFAFIIIMIQLLESYLWIGLKLTPSPQEQASIWVLQNIKSKSEIGIENIPLYQAEPDIVLKEFYAKQYDQNFKSKFNYLVIDSNAKKLPRIIILSNTILSREIDLNSDKKKLLTRLSKEGYIEIYQATPKLKFYELFGNNFNYFYSGLIGYPTDVSIFEKK